MYILCRANRFKKKQYRIILFTKFSSSEQWKDQNWTVYYNGEGVGLCGSRMLQVLGKFENLLNSLQCLHQRGGSAPLEHTGL